MEPSSKRNAIITWVSGSAFCRLPELDVFFKSIRRTGCLADIIVMTHDMEQDYREELLSQGIEIVDIPKDNIHMVVRDRFLAIYEFLAKNPHKYNHIILADSKDIVFQENPFKFALWNFPSLDKCVLLCSEGGEHYKSEWNSVNQLIVQQNVAQFSMAFINRPILNSGFIYGTPEELKFLSLLIWTNTCKTLQPVSEQGILNYLCFFLERDPIFKIFTPQEKAFVLTGEGCTRKWVDYEFKDGKFHHPKLNMPFAVVHQWERILEHKKSVFEQYID
jgi:hypothetical protein